MYFFMPNIFKEFNQALGVKWQILLAVPEVFSHRTNTGWLKNNILKDCIFVQNYFDYYFQKYLLVKPS